MYRRDPMASQVSKPVDRRFALGLLDGFRAPVMSNLTLAVWRSVFGILFVLALACHEAPPPAEKDCSSRAVRMGVASSLREIALSLREDLTERHHPIEIELIFGASSVLARQLALGAPMDLLVSADAEIVEALVRRNKIRSDSTVELARGRLVIAARKNWEMGGEVGRTFESSQLRRIAIPSAAVPLGRYARFWLEQQGHFEKLGGKIVTTEHARATLSSVEQGHVDLAIVYESDARLARHATTLATIDVSEYPPIRYVAGRSTSAPDCPSISGALDAWTSPATTRRFAQSGFLPTLATQDRS